jgi:hypothetical protein
MRDSPIEIELFHIKGHQDDVPYNVLNRFESLNVVMDSHAKAHWTTVHDDDDFVRHEWIPGEGWPLWIGFEKTTGEVHTSITEQVHTSDIEQYWEKRHRFPVGHASVRRMKLLSMSFSVKILGPRPSGRNQWTS